MKKIVASTLLIALSLIGLASCALPHEHTYRDTWSSDLEYHWHYCGHDRCTELIDKTPHVWDDGIVVAEPTTVLDGLKKYTCTECGAIRTDDYKYDGN